MRKIATPTDLDTELKALQQWNRQGASRDELATSLRRLADRVASDGADDGQRLAAGTAQFDRYIQLAADDVKSLRKPDVYRVLEQAKSAKELDELVQYIAKKNPALKTTLEEDSADLGDERGWAKKAGGLSLWKFDPARDSWTVERDVTPETAEQWLERFKRDEPDTVFEIADKKPRKKPDHARGHVHVRQDQIDKHQREQAKADARSKAVLKSLLERDDVRLTR
jgi:hypothetical protein